LGTSLQPSLAEQPKWLDKLAEDCKAILASKLLEAKYELGRRIKEEFGYHKLANQHTDGVSEQELARRLGVSQQAVSQWIRFYELVQTQFNDNITDFVQRTGYSSWRDVVHEILPRTRRLPENKPLPALPDARYRTVVIDPPWPVQKIIRQVRPKQVAKLDYDRMSLDAIKYFLGGKLIDHTGCHVYLWTTHRFLPTCFELFREWGVSYECLLTWIKNVGFTPYSWMYSTEHALFGRVGNLEVRQKGVRLEFQGNVREHSRKPEEFYDLVRTMSPEPRIEIFSREKHEGFDQYGLEVEKFVIAG
jgi:N6-adenosine-specific RNA methylase IME4